MRVAEKETARQPLFLVMFADKKTDTVADGEWAQAIGYSNSVIHDRRYQLQILEVEIVSGFIDTLSNHAMMRLIRYMSLTRDVHAPSKPICAIRGSVA